MSTETYQKLTSPQTQEPKPRLMHFIAFKTVREYNRNREKNRKLCLEEKGKSRGDISRVKNSAIKYKTHHSKTKHDPEPRSTTKQNPPQQQPSKKDSKQNKPQHKNQQTHREEQNANGTTHLLQIKQPDQPRTSQHYSIRSQRK